LYYLNKKGDAMPNADKDVKDIDQAASRRVALKKLGKYAAVSAPTVTLLLASMTKPSAAISSIPPP
jgi:hypothetical protein